MNHTCKAGTDRRGVNEARRSPDSPTCSECRSGYLGDDGVFCRTFNEIIHDENVAQRCEAYDPKPQGPERTVGQ